MTIGLWTTKPAHCITVPLLSPSPSFAITSSLLHFAGAAQTFSDSLFAHCAFSAIRSVSPFTCKLNGPSPKYLYNPHRTACNSLCLTHVAPCSLASVPFPADIGCSAILHPSLSKRFEDLLAHLLLVLVLPADDRVCAVLDRDRSALEIFSDESGEPVLCPRT